jgi:hypothetical protein
MESTTKPLQSMTPRLPANLRLLQPKIVDDLVRLGNQLDGGYVVSASAVRDSSALLSFGLGGDWSFERDAAQLNNNLTIHVYDHTLGERAIFRSLMSSCRDYLGEQNAQSLLEIRSAIEFYDSYSGFFVGDRRTHFVERVVGNMKGPQEATIEVAFSRLGDLGSLIMKVDIEGDEYAIVDQILAFHDRLAMVVIEFHATECLRAKFLDAVSRILQYFEIVHIHGNNHIGVAADGLPDVLELTFLHKKRCKPISTRERLPVANLDYPNDPRNADHAFSFEAAD